MTTTLPGIETLRYADLLDLTRVLNAQNARSFDVVTDRRSFRFDDDTTLNLSGVAEPMLFNDGVTDVNGSYVPTSLADEGLSEKLKVPLGWLRDRRADMPDLYASVLNRVLRDDKRNFLLRFLRSDNEHEGVLRAFLSDQYMRIDHLDVLMAVLQGITEAGVENPIVEADLTERRMIVRVAVPGIAVYAPDFLKDYRNPFDGSSAARGWTPDRLRRAAEAEGHKVDDKVIFAGFVFTNGETGDAAYSLTPRLVIGACTNGLQLVAETTRKAHLGAKLNAGLVQWSEETLRANLDLITKQSTDTVRTYLDKDYITKQVEKLTEKASERIDNAQPVIAAVAKKLSFTEAQQSLILSHFVQGGQMTVGGVMQAITSASQVIADGDTAYEMEASAIKAMNIAHTAIRELVKAGN